eukprot:TRINITY_DN775_c0_g1_i1.p1 TRINITY_DN775_c0_g1~~TRINITY_DN775_c0_g1_i1.p1  ORF type:complete len:333 (-),score=54.71 TRINITY_DN775_c0_g1_i1:129-998(-)
MPQLGIGTWQSKPEQVGAAVEHAVKVGYRHIDCAWIYSNQKEVGDAIKRCIPKYIQSRAELFITSKLWNTDHKPDRVKHACKTTLNELKIDYLDMYLIHWPVALLNDNETVDRSAKIQDTWQAMQALVEEGLVKSIGVSNFSEEHLHTLIDETDIIPTTNQIEVHPLLTQSKLLDYCQQNGIVVTAYSPLARGSTSKAAQDDPRYDLLNQKTVRDIAAKYNKSPAQVCIRWALQKQLIVIPKSVTPRHIEENLHVFDFTLDADDMTAINKLNINHRTVVPKWYKFPDQQ